MRSGKMATISFVSVERRRLRPTKQSLAMARTEDRVLLTEDRDFGQLVIQQQLPVLGVVLIELDVLSNDAEAARVLSVFQSTGIDMAGNLVVIEPSRTRVRPLPGRERD